MTPFERYGIDPRGGVQEITARFRELIEEAAPERRAELRAAWEALTLHPRRRVQAALRTPPSLPPAPVHVPGDPGLAEPLRSVLEALGDDVPTVAHPSSPAALASDPFLTGTPPGRTVSARRSRP